MKAGWIVGLMFLLPACGATMVSTRGKDVSNFAPINERQRKGGEVRYSNWGDTYNKRKDAYRQMHDFCGGEYKITHEEEREKVKNAYGHTAAYWYIDFECADPK